MTLVVFSKSRLMSSVCVSMASISCLISRRAGGGWRGGPNCCLDRSADCFDCPLCRRLGRLGRLSSQVALR